MVISLTIIADRIITVRVRKGFVITLSKEIKEILDICEDDEF